MHDLSSPIPADARPAASSIVERLVRLVIRTNGHDRDTDWTRFGDDDDDPLGVAGLRWSDD